MKAFKNTQAGIGHIVVLFIIVFVAAAGFAGWKVMNMNKATTTETANVTSTPKVPEKLKTKSDLAETGKVLDNSASDVNGGLNDSSLNADLNDML